MYLCSEATGQNKSLATPWPHGHRALPTVYLGTSGASMGTWECGSVGVWECESPGASG